MIYRSSTEQETRGRLIDRDLARAGWGNAQRTLIEEFALSAQADDHRDSLEYADYALLGSDGNPIAVVEAKRSSRDELAGKRQASDYADRLKARFGHDPFVFLTNGQTIQFWDRDRYPPRKINGFYTHNDPESYRIKITTPSLLEPSPSHQTETSTTMPPDVMTNQVFISYRHESPEHAAQVRWLGDLLKSSGLPVLLDQFYMDKHPGGPDEGWPKWCEGAAAQSNCVLIVGSVGWFAVYENKEKPGTGCGAASEADIFRQELYDNKGENPRIRLVYLHKVGREDVPLRLRAWHHFRPLDNETDRAGLIQWISGRLAGKASELTNPASPISDTLPTPLTQTASAGFDSISLAFPRDLIEFLAENYPDVRNARALWQRAGGRSVEVENNPRPFDLWQHLWRRSVQGATVSPHRLLKAAQVEYPGNPLLVRYLAQWPDSTN